MNKFQHQNNLTKNIGDYSFNLGNLLGQGYSSKVYKGVHIATQMPVAVKVISIADVCTRIAQTLLRNEIEILLQLKHENILRVYGVFESTRHYYIVSEFCEDGDLAELLQHKSLTEDESLTILRQIVEALKTLQELRIIHRDIKPANILRSKGSFKLADFGFALFSNQEESIIKKFVVGTPMHMAPETVEANSYSQKSDVWALGVVLFQMIYREYPFKGGQFSAYKLDRIKKDESLSHAVRSLLVGMLSYDPDARLSVDEIDKILKNKALADKAKPVKRINSISLFTAPMNRSSKQLLLSQPPLLCLSSDREILYKCSFLDDEVKQESQKLPLEGRQLIQSEHASPKYSQQPCKRIRVPLQSSPVKQKIKATLPVSEFLSDVMQNYKKQAPVDKIVRTECDSHSTDISLSGKSVEPECPLSAPIRPTFKFCLFLDGILRKSIENDELRTSLKQLLAIKALHIRAQVPEPLEKTVEGWVAAYHTCTQEESEADDFQLEGTREFFEGFQEVLRRHSASSEDPQLQKDLLQIQEVVTDNSKQSYDPLLFARKWENQRF